MILSPTLDPRAPTGQRAPSRCASLDGDADRIVFWAPGPGGAVRLLDGDKIAALAALLVRDLLAALPAGARAPTVRPLAQNPPLSSLASLRVSGNAGAR
jgi:phosphomannomutase